MVRTLSATEAKVNFGSVARQVVGTGDPVIVESHGHPTVAIVPVEHVDRLRELEDQERRRAALENLRHLQTEIAARNQDLTDERADEIADQIVRTAIDALFENGTVRYAE